MRRSEREPLYVFTQRRPPWLARRASSAVGAGWSGASRTSPYGRARDVNIRTRLERPLNSRTNGPTRIGKRISSFSVSRLSIWSLDHQTMRAGDHLFVITSPTLSAPAARLTISAGKISWDRPEFDCCSHYGRGFEYYRLKIRLAFIMSIKCWTLSFMWFSEISVWCVGDIYNFYGWKQIRNSIDIFNWNIFLETSIMINVHKVCGWK
jgi:hypothetical protein